MRRGLVLVLFPVAVVVLGTATCAVSTQFDSDAGNISPVSPAAVLFKAIHSVSDSLSKRKVTRAETPASGTTAGNTARAPVLPVSLARGAATSGPIRSSSVRTGGSKLSGEDCGTSEECKGTRVCITISGAAIVTCALGSSRCVCFFPTIAQNLCEKSSSCETGERCVLSRELNVKLCTSCKASLPGTTSNVDGGNCGSSAACISIDALSHLDRSALVFRTHREADVLCDAHGSCATAGHIVVHNGRSMMMRTYCEAHGDCVEKRMLVNSPRLNSRNVRVASNTSSLEFTALSARYHTWLEERVMKALVRMGW